MILEGLHTAVPCSLGQISALPSTRLSGRLLLTRLVKRIYHHLSEQSDIRNPQPISASWIDVRTI